MLALLLVGSLAAVGEGSAPPFEPVAAAAGDPEPPKVVTMEPENGAIDLDAKKTLRLIVTFDRAMSDDQSFSFCPDGGDFPKFKAKAYWDTPKKVAVDVALEPGHTYRMALNCADTGFKSKEGVALVPVHWSFSTAPDKVPDPVKQKAENHKAFAALQNVLAESYSYYDLRVHDWDKLFHQSEPTVIAAKTTHSWAIAVAKMLEPTEDLHMSLQLGDERFGVGHRSVDSLFRPKLLDKYATVQPVGKLGLIGRTSDGIGYLTIFAWENDKEIEGIIQALPKLRDCKAIVVDARPNAGGSDVLADHVAAWFVEGTKVFAKDRHRVRHGKNGFDSVLDRTITGNKEPAQRFDVPVAVLTSRYVMSSNESFVMMMKQARDCTTVGQPTYGSSGAPRPHELPNGVTIYLPSWQDMRLDGTCFEGEGLAPDVLVDVETKQLETTDPILEKALEILRGKLAAAK